MNENELLDLMEKAASKQIDLSDRVLNNHLDAADRVHAREASQSIVNIAKVLGMSEEPTPNPT